MNGAHPSAVSSTPVKSSAATATATPAKTPVKKVVPSVPMFGGVSATVATKMLQKSPPRKKAAAVAVAQTVAATLTARETLLLQLEEYKKNGVFHEKVKQAIMHCDVYALVHEGRSEGAINTRKVFLHNLKKGKSSLKAINHVVLETAVGLAKTEAQNAKQTGRKISLPKDIDQYHRYNVQALDRELQSQLGLISTRQLLLETLDQVRTLNGELKAEQEKLRKTNESATKAAAELASKINAADEQLTKTKEANRKSNDQLEAKKQQITQLKEKEAYLLPDGEAKTATATATGASPTDQKTAVAASVTTANAATTNNAAASLSLPAESLLQQLEERKRNAGIYDIIRSMVMHCDVYGLTHTDRTEDVEAARKLYIDTLKRLKDLASSKSIDTDGMRAAKSKLKEKAEDANRGISMFGYYSSPTCLPKDADQYYLYDSNTLDKTLFADLGIVSTNTLLESSHKELGLLVAELVEIKVKLADAVQNDPAAKLKRLESAVAAEKEKTSKLEQQLKESDAEITRLNTSIEALKKAADEKRKAAAVETKSTGGDSTMSDASKASANSRVNRDPQNNNLVNRNRFQDTVSINCFAFISKTIQLSQSEEKDDQDIKPYATRLFQALVINSGRDVPDEEKQVFDKAFSTEVTAKNPLVDKLWKRLPGLRKNPAGVSKDAKSHLTEEAAGPEDYPEPLSKIGVRGALVNNTEERSIYHIVLEMLSYGYYFPKDREFAVEFVASNSYALKSLLRSALTLLVKYSSEKVVENVLTKLVASLDAGQLNKNDFLERLVRTVLDLNTKFKNDVLRIVFEKVVASRTDSLKQDFLNALGIVGEESAYKDKYKFPAVVKDKTAVAANGTASKLSATSPINKAGAAVVADAKKKEAEKEKAAVVNGTAATAAAASTAPTNTAK